MIHRSRRCYDGSQIRLPVLKGINDCCTPAA